MLINKSQLSNDVNNKVNFQKIWIPFLMFYLKFLSSRHTKPKLFYGTLSEGCIVLLDLLH